MMKTNVIIAAVIVLLSAAIVGCTNDTETPAVDPIQKIEANVDGETNKSIIQIDGTLFSVSSPLESVVQLKNSASDYRESLLVSDIDLSKLTSSFDQAMHMGLMSADLGYTSIHDQQAKSLEQFKTISDLASKLDVSNAIDKNLIKRLSSNVSNEDSLMVLISEMYRKADSYLKDNDRMDVAALILAGGWIESMHLSLDEIKNGNKQLKEGVASQHTSFQNLIALLKKNDKSPQSNDLIKKLEKIETIFDDIVYNYNYERPTIDADKRLTVLRGKTEYNMSEETLLELYNAVENIRTDLLK